MKAWTFIACVVGMHGAAQAVCNSPYECSQVGTAAKSPVAVTAPAAHDPLEERIASLEARTTALDERESALEKRMSMKTRLSEGKSKILKTNENEPPISRTGEKN